MWMRNVNVLMHMFVIRVVCAGSYTGTETVHLKVFYVCVSVLYVIVLCCACTFTYDVKAHDMDREKPQPMEGKLC